MALPLAAIVGAQLAATAGSSIANRIGQKKKHSRLSELAAEGNSRINANMAKSEALGQNSLMALANNANRDPGALKQSYLADNVLPATGGLRVGNSRMYAERDADRNAMRAAKANTFRDMIQDSNSSIADNAFEQSLLARQRAQQQALTMQSLRRAGGTGQGYQNVGQGLNLLSSVIGAYGSSKG